MSTELEQLEASVYGFLRAVLSVRENQHSFELWNTTERRAYEVEEGLLEINAQPGGFQINDEAWSVALLKFKFAMSVNGLDGITTESVGTNHKVLAKVIELTLDFLHEVIVLVDMEKETAVG